MLKDDTKYFPREAYPQAIFEYLKMLKPHYTDISAIYQFGDVGQPGLSDIDLIVVMKNNCHQQKYTDYTVPRQNDSLTYLICHDPLFVNEEIFRKIKYGYPIFKLSWLWGKGIDYEQVLHDENKEINILNLLNTFLTKVPSDYIRYIYREEQVSCRLAIAMLNSFKHMYALLFSITGERDSGSENYIERLDGLRKGWFQDNSLEKLEQLKEMIKESLYVIADLVKKTDIMVRHQYNLTPKGDLIFKNRTFYYIFKKEWEKEIFIKEIESRGTIYFPYSFSLFLQHASRQKNVYGQYCKRILKPHNHKITGIQENSVINEHNMIKDKYITFMKNCFMYPPLPYIGMGYQALGSRIYNKVKIFLKRER